MPGTMVNFPTNGTTTAGYLATPSSGKGPGVLVIQEWWGLVGHIKKVCDRFAAEGFSALAPDLYHGKTADEPDTAGKLFMALNIAQAEKDLRGALKFLGPLVDGKARRRRLLHGRPARAVRRDAQPRRRRDGELLRHPSQRQAGLFQARGPGARAVRREGRVRDAAGGEGDRRRDQEGGQDVGDPHLPGRGPRLLQRRAPRRLQQDGRRRRRAAYAGVLPPAPEIGDRPAGITRAWSRPDPRVNAHVEVTDPDARARSRPLP